MLGEKGFAEYANEREWEIIGVLNNDMKLVVQGDALKRRSDENIRVIGGKEAGASLSCLRTVDFLFIYQ